MARPLGSHLHRTGGLRVQSLISVPGGHPSPGRGKLSSCLQLDVGVWQKWANVIEQLTKSLLIFFLFDVIIAYAFDLG